MLREDSHPLHGRPLLVAAIDWIKGQQALTFRLDHSLEACQEWGGIYHDRSVLSSALETVFKKVDLVLVPTMPALV